MIYFLFLNTLALEVLMAAPGEEGGQKKVNSELSYQNKSCSECQQDVRKHYVNMSVCRYVRMQLLSLGIKMKVVPNVIRRKLWKSVREWERVRENERKSEWMREWESENLYGQLKSFFKQKSLLSFIVDPAKSYSEYPVAIKPYSHRRWSGGGF